MTIEIDKNIPIPERNQVGRKTKYPFAEMEIGDSFLSRCDTADAKKVFSVKTNMHRSASYHKQQEGAKRSYRTRIEPEGIRMWRVL